MEVHHHSHTARKKWTHYFWEFIMLFLAVTLGFFVENQREHYIEHQRAKVYAANLCEELKKDTANLNPIIEQNKTVFGKLDTFCLYSNEKTKRTVTSGMLYYYSSFVTWINFFTSANTTVEQLKGSGNLRIMGNEVAQKISEYGKRLEDLKNEYNLTRTEFEKMESLYFQIFDGYISVQLEPAYKNPGIRDSVFRLNISLINDDPKLMREFTGWMKFESGIYKMQNSRHHLPLKKFITELLVLLKKEYHLE